MYGTLEKSRKLFYIANTVYLERFYNHDPSLVARSTKKLGWFRVFKHNGLPLLYYVNGRGKIYHSVNNSFLTRITTGEKEILINNSGSPVLFREVSRLDLTFNVV